MKKYTIFVAIGIISTICIIGFPQLTGTAFINNHKEKKPLDWLSAQVLKWKKGPGTLKYDIPEHIQAIKITGRTFWGYISVYEDNDRHVKYSDRNYATFTVSGDTLIIAGKDPNLTIFADSSIHTLIFDHLKRTTVDINHTLPLDLITQNQSHIILHGNRNTKLDKMNISGQSTFNLALCFTPVIDMQIDNSMVYVDVINNIDSLKATLIGKSNIKTEKFTNTSEHTNRLFREFNLTKWNADIYPTGNLEYYNLVQKEKK